MPLDEFRTMRRMEKSIILVSNELELREGLAPLLSEITGFSCAAFTSGEDAVEHVRRHPVSVALISLTLPDMDLCKN